MIPIFKPYMPGGISSELEQILYSGSLSFSKYGKEFESKIATFLDNENTIIVSSYNHALLIVLSVLGLKPGDEVIASPVSCLASNQPFVVKNLKVIWADVDSLTGAMLVEDVKNKISNKTKAIFHNHYCGYLGNINEINALGASHGIPVIDDCIEGFGSELNHHKTGNVGSDITVFSFQTVRLPNTIDGGAIVFRNKDLFEKAKLIRDYGIDRSIFRNNLNEINLECDVALEGYGGLMSEVNALIGLRQIDKIPFLIRKQRENAKKWDEILNDSPHIAPLKTTEGTLPNYWVYGILAENKNETISMFRKKGFYASSIHINNNIYSVFNNKIELKGVSEFMKHFVALPCGWWLNEEQITL